MTDKQYLLGIDNGGTVAKALLLSTDGQEIAVARRNNRTISDRPGWIEFDAEALWQATAAAIREVLKKARIAPHLIAAVACTGHGNGLYLVDAAGHPTRRAIFSSDSRAQGYIDRWCAAGLDRVLRAKTLQGMWPGQPNALLAWLADHEPDTLRRSRWALMCKDYIRLRLTGKAAAEQTDISGTSLLNVLTGQYDSDLLEPLGIGPFAGLLPHVCLSNDLCGEITPQAAAETGLAPGTPVAGGMFDIDACALSSALLDDGPLGMTLGTWGINQYVATEPVTDEYVLMTSRYCVPGHYLMFEGSATSASNLEWFLTEVFPEAAASPPPGKTIYEVLNDAVAATDPADSDIVFLPFLYGANVGAQASAALAGLSHRHHRAEVVRAVFEGVVFAHYHHYQRLLHVRRPPGVLRTSGGATRSDAWMQIVADLYQIPVETPVGTELGARGAAMCAGTAIGCYSSYLDACRKVVRFTRRFEPDPRRAGIYRRKYRRYCRVAQALAEAWPEPEPEHS